ncbi:unnamed protein product [Vitrella brassicaformis CCMP3155]|uniref:Uncharacterized protein n=1 Tax=Vitrella brassicaformis (strain CCMP3155) TaxID=1169540 RepID=A0A0G4GAU9_VITBC|nr:unnamed protein product [Vitrella brassicaformis CCMP3155]|eukprot:CEM25929.1 unnamed protein product [Vitrella brassicaformis CCMP3155]
MGGTVSSSRSSDVAPPAINGQVLDMVHRDGRDDLYDDTKDIGRLRSTALFIGNVDFPAQTLRGRLNRSLHRIPLADGTRLDAVITFDTQTVTGARLLLAAMWMVEQQKSDEVAEVLQLASKCRYCTLPVNITADDINIHADKTAYSFIARVLAQLMVVGRHVHFGDGSCLQFYRHGNEVRAIKDEPGFRLTVDPPPAADHLYQQHRLEHDPPVRDRIYYYNDGMWLSHSCASINASVSSLVKDKILDHFKQTHQIDDTGIFLNRYVGGGRLDGPLTQSPHAPVAECTTTLSLHGGDVRELVLTDNSHPFVAWISIADTGNNTVFATVWTTETAAPGVSEYAPFKDRFPLTTWVARVVLEVVAPFVFDGQVQQQQPQVQPPQQQQPQ